MKRFALDRGRAGALILTALLLAPVAAAAQQRGGDDDWCRNEQSGDDRGRACVVREFTVPATAGTLAVAGTNGGISVEGEARGDVRILARISATPKPTPGRQSSSRLSSSILRSTRSKPRDRRLATAKAGR